VARKEKRGVGGVEWSGKMEKGKKRKKRKEGKSEKWQWTSGN
jgi:hypothetical protein